MANNPVDKPGSSERYQISVFDVPEYSGRVDYSEWEQKFDSVTGFEEPGIPKDDFYGILSCERRRAVIRYLGDKDKCKLRDLSDAVAAVENNMSVEEVTGEERKKVRIALYQTHLDKMDDVGVVDYNKDRGIIEKGRLFDQFHQNTDDSLHTYGRITEKDLEQEKEETGVSGRIRQFLS